MNMNMLANFPNAEEKFLRQGKPSVKLQSQEQTLQGNPYPKDYMCFNLIKAC